MKPLKAPAIKIISGGQTGVDRAALDVALKLGIECGGWCPQGRLAEDGLIDEKYPLQETPSTEYIQRTEWNVRDCDGVLILIWGDPVGGTKKAIEFTSVYKKPMLHIDLQKSERIQTVGDWIKAHQITTINIVGPRASEAPDSYEKARAFLMKIF